MSAFYFFYGITFVLVCMVAVCVSVCTYLVSHRTSYLTVSAFFFFDTLESAIVFLDEYQGRKMMADILSSQFPMTRLITKLVPSIGIMASMWAFALAIVNKTSRLHMLAPCIAFSAFEAMSLVLQPDSIKQLAFYALRFSAPPATFGTSAKQIAEVRFSPFCDQNDISAREREVLDLLLDGQDNRAIANDLFISVGTAKSHVHTIFRKCGASSRSELLQSFWAG